MYMHSTFSVSYMHMYNYVVSYYIILLQVKSLDKNPSKQGFACATDDGAIIHLTIYNI